MRWASSSTSSTTKSLGHTYPEVVKPTMIITLHKRGLSTVLANKRGTTLSNFPANTPFSWLNFLLMKYNVVQRIVPETQLATQPGVQSRDLTRMPAQINTWAHRHNKPIYVLKRDQTKGFGMLDSSSFLNALGAHGLPKFINALVISGMCDVSFTVRTAHDDSKPFTLYNLTRQGESLGPLKSSITTSLGNRWPHDQASRHDTVMIQTSAAEAGFRHSPADDPPTSEIIERAFISSYVLLT